MSILALLNRVCAENAKANHPFINRNLAMRRSYLTGVAMLAHADGDIEPAERELFQRIARAFEINQDLADEIFDRAALAREETVLEIRENLIESKFKYYFLLDLLIMAHQDGHQGEVETQVVTRFCELLMVDADDARFLTDLAQAVVAEDADSKREWAQSFFAKMRIGPAPEPGDFQFYTSDKP